MRRTRLPGRRRLISDVTADEIISSDNATEQPAAGAVEKFKEIDSTRYSLFKLRHKLHGLWLTRRYWRLLLADKRVRHLWYARIIGICFGILVSFGLLFVVAGGLLATIKSHLNLGESILMGFIALLFIMVSFLLGVIISALFWDGFGTLPSKHPWHKYRAVWQNAVLRSVLQPMGLRVWLNRLESNQPADGRAYALLDRTTLGDDIYIPRQSQFVSNIVMRYLYTTAQDKYDLLASYKSTFAEEGIRLVLQRAYQYQAFMKRQSEPAQVGFGGMVLQQGESAFALFNTVTADEYATLSWYGIACADMPTVVKTPLFLLKEVYQPDPTVMHEMRNDMSAQHIQWSIKYLKENNQAYKPRLVVHMLKEYELLQNDDPNFRLP